MRSAAAMAASPAWQSGFGAWYIFTSQRIGEHLVWEIIQAAGWPIWPLILASIITVAIIGERLWALRANVIAPSNNTWLEVRIDWPDGGGPGSEVYVYARYETEERQREWA